MNSSVKFFEPTVIVTLPFAGSDLIRPLGALGLPPAVELELELLPQAATSSTAAIATANANTARSLLLEVDKTIPFPLVTSPAVRRASLILCAPAGALQPQPLGGEEMLDAGEDELHHEREHGDADRAGQDPLAAVDVPLEDEVTEIRESHHRCDRRGRDDVDRRGPHAAHDRRHRERHLDLEDDPELAHAHAPGRIDGATVDLADPDEAVGEDGRHAEHHQRD